MFNVIMHRNWAVVSLTNGDTIICAIEPRRRPEGLFLRTESTHPDILDAIFHIDLILGDGPIPGTPRKRQPKTQPDDDIIEGVVVEEMPRLPYAG